MLDEELILKMKAVCLCLLCNFQVIIPVLVFRQFHTIQHRHLCRQFRCAHAFRVDVFPLEVTLHP